MTDLLVDRSRTEAPGSNRAVRRGRFRPGGVLRFVFIALYTGFLLLPLYWMAVTSIKSQDDQLSEPPVW